jgi:hypothetical protein
MRADHHLALGGCGGRHFVMSETQDFLASELTLGMYPPRIPLICFSECRYFRCTPFTLLWVFWVLLGRCVLGAAGAPSRQRDLVVHPKHPGKAHPEYRVTGKREKERPTQALIWCLRGAAEQRQLVTFSLGHLWRIASWAPSTSKYRHGTVPHATSGSHRKK